MAVFFAFGRLGLNKVDSGWDSEVTLSLFLTLRWKMAVFHVV